MSSSSSSSNISDNYDKELNDSLDHTYNIAKHKNIIIRNIHIGELINCLNHIGTGDIQCYLKHDPRILSNQSIRYAAAFHLNSTGKFLGMCAWNSNINKLHILKTIKCEGNCFIACLLASHAISFTNKSKFSKPMEIDGFKDDSDFDDNERSMLNDVLEKRENGTFLLHRDVCHKLIGYPFQHKQDKLPSKYIEMIVNIKYKPNLAQASHERSPEIHIYTSSDIARGVVIIKPDKTHISNDGKTYIISNKRLSFKLISKKILSDCLINFDSYAKHLNEKNEWCTNQSGYGNIPLCSLLNRTTQAIDLSVTNSKNLNNIKGELIIEVTSSNKSELVFEKSFEEFSTDSIRKELDDHEKIVRRYIDKNRKHYSRFRSSQKSVQYVTVFVDQTRVGYIPGSMFDIFHITKARENFHLNCLKIALMRYHKLFDISLDDQIIEKYWLNYDQMSNSDDGKNYRSKIVMRMLTVYVTTCPYITDEFDANSLKDSSQWYPSLLEMIESFDNMFPRDAGDCEDFSKAMLRIVAELKFHSTHFVSKSMSIVKSILDKYLFFSVLCGVSNKALTKVPNQGTELDQQLNGHEGVFAIPKYIFYKSLERYDDKHMIIQRTLPHELVKGKNESIYVLEGTGMLIPEPSKETNQEIAIEQILRSIQNESDFIKHSRTYLHYDPSSPSNFYKQMITLITNEFFSLGLPFAEFLLIYKDQKNINNSTRGVWFNDLLDIDNNKSIAVAPCPGFSYDLIYAYTRISKDNYPMTKLKELKLNEQMIAISKMLTIKKRRIQERGNISQTFYLRFDAVTKKILEEIIRFSVSSGLSIRTRPEPIRINDNGHIVGSYAIQFYN